MGVICFNMFLFGDDLFLDQKKHDHHGDLPGDFNKETSSPLYI